MPPTASPPEYLTTVAIAPDVIAALDLGIEAMMNGKGEIALPASHRPFAFSVHLPITDDTGRLNLAALDDARREQSIGIVRRSVDAASDLGVSRGVIHPGFTREGGATIGDWDRAVAGLQQVADHARRKQFEVLLENMPVKWDGVPDYVPAEEADRSRSLHYLGSSAQEWRDLWAADMLEKMPPLLVR